MLQQEKVVNIYCNTRKHALKEKKDTLDFLSKKICILTPPHCFFIAYQIKLNLRKFNIECKISCSGYVNRCNEITSNEFGINDVIDNDNYNYIVICPQSFKELPYFYVAYQMEQKTSKWFTPNYLEILNNSHSVLDYSTENIKHLADKELHWQQFFYAPIGGIPNYKSFLEEVGYNIVPQEEKYDVLFYGSICERRQKIINELSKSLHIHVVSNCFGEELISKILNSKVVVNIHYYEDAILETTRIYEILSLGVPVVSEDSIDIDEHKDLDKVVKFVKSGCINSLIQEISLLLNNESHYNSTVESTKNYVTRSHYKASYYFSRYMLAWDCISFNDFYRHNKEFTGLDLNTVKLCLSLDENNRSKKIKSTLDQEEFNIFTGLRHNISWKGCGLSYMYIARRALDKGIKSLTICEDDVTFNEVFKTNYQTIQRYLNQNKNKWHLFSGLCAQVHKDTKILKIEKFEGIEFIYIDKIVSTVFNIYSTEMLERLSEWDYKNTSQLQQIDRYIESMNDLVAVITAPFLVGHDSKQKSTIWNFDNIEYDNMITESQNLLSSKIDEFKQGTKI